MSYIVFSIILSAWYSNKNILKKKKKTYKGMLTLLTHLYLLNNTILCLTHTQKLSCYLLSYLHLDTIGVSHREDVMRRHGGNYLFRGFMYMRERSDSDFEKALLLSSSLRPDLYSSGCTNWVPCQKELFLGTILVFRPVLLALAIK